METRVLCSARQHPLTRLDLAPRGIRRGNVEKKKKQRTDKVKKREETKKKEREEARKEAEKENQREKETRVANSSHRQTTLISGY